MGQGTIYEDGTYLEKNPTWHEQDSPWKAEQISRMLAKHNITPASVCEIGCGAGGILETLTKSLDRSVAFSGYDISPQAIEVARKKAGPNLQFFLQDPFEDQGAAFDVVLAIDVFEHVEDYFGFLRRLKGKGTYKIFHIPLDLSVQSVLRKAPILNARASVGHIHYFTKDTALATLKDAGYEVIDWFYTKSALELSKRGWKAGMVKLPRKIFFAIHPDLAVRVLGGFSLLVLAK